MRKFELKFVLHRLGNRLETFKPAQYFLCAKLVFKMIFYVCRLCNFIVNNRDYRVIPLKNL